MKSHQSQSIRARRLIETVFASTLCMVFSQPVTSFADTVTATPADSQYKFFMGINVRIPDSNGDLPVVDFRDGKVILWSQGKAAPVDYKDLKQVKLIRTPKLSREVVDVSDFKSETANSTGTQELQNMMTCMLLQDMAEDARDMSNKAVSNSNSQTANSNPSKGSAFYSEISKAASASAARNTSLDRSTPGTDTKFQKNETNTIVVDFMVSAPKPVDDAYALVVALIKMGGDDSVLQPWLHFEELGRIDSTPRQIHVSQSGMPAGFEIADTGVFVYSRGEEIANSMSSKLMAVSDEEARLLINTDYLESHKEQSLHPTLATGSISDKTIVSLKKAGVSGDITLHLDEEGMVISAECAGKPVSEEAVDLLNTLIFHPGLKDGQAVASSVKLNMEQFSAKNLGKLARQ